jgi:hypothetical protein
MSQRLLIVISSPADVPDERLRTALIVDKLCLGSCRFVGHHRIRPDT